MLDKTTIELYVGQNNNWALCWTKQQLSSMLDKTTIELYVGQNNYVGSENNITYNPISIIVLKTWN